MICPNCNKSVNEQSVYCNHCGNKLNLSEIDNWVNVYIDFDGININSNELTWQHCKRFGTIAYSKGNYFEAIEYFCEAAKFKNESLSEISNLYNELAISYGQVDKIHNALIYFDLAISANEDNNVALMNRARIRLNQRDETGAINDINMLIKLEKMDSSLWHLLGLAFENTKQYENARTAYQTALSQGYHQAAKDLGDILLKIKQSN
jgi:tetratricopeptide (TPR) repeat protein